MTKLFFKEKNSFSFIEISIVLLIISIPFGLLVSFRKIKSNASYLSALKETNNAFFFSFRNLSFWLDFTILNKKFINTNINNITARSKKFISFEAKNSPKVIKSSLFLGLNSIYFNGSNYLVANNSLDLTKYTSILVLNPKNYTKGTIINNGIINNIDEIKKNNIVIIKNDGYKKYIKTFKTDFIEIENIDIFNQESSQIIIGKDYIGEILEIIIFDTILSNNKIQNIENYLINKYKS